MAATLETDSYKPWLDNDDGAHTLFISSHGYGHVNPAASVAQAIEAGTMQPNGAAVPPASTAAASSSNGASSAVASKPTSKPQSWFYPGSGDVACIALPDEMQPACPGGPTKSSVDFLKDMVTLDREAEGGPYAGRAPPAEAKPASVPVAATSLSGESIDELAQNGSRAFGSWYNMNATERAYCWASE